MANNRAFFLMFGFLVLAATVSAYLVAGRGTGMAPARRSFSGFPDRAGGWRTIDVQSPGEAQTRELNADDFISRTYANDRGLIAYFSAAWYAGQRHRRTIHSPQNCIPGAGWSMSAHRIHTLAVQPSKTSGINEYSIEKDGNRMLAFYWYQGRGRITAGDYSSRFHLLYDGLTTGRHDGGLVRVIVPIPGGAEAEFRARAAGLNFARTMIPLLDEFIP